MHTIFKSVWVRNLIGKLGGHFSRSLQVRVSPRPQNSAAGLSLPAAESNAFPRACLQNGSGVKVTAQTGGTRRAATGLACGAGTLQCDTARLAKDSVD
jgi:hypothetical protein